MNISRAERLLQSLGITEPEEIDLEAIAWDQGADVRYRKLEGCEARIIGTGNKAIISINSVGNERRKRFSIGHELGHWCHHRGKSFICRKEDIGNNAKEDWSHPERVADRYAADLLLPSYIFKPIVNQFQQPNFKTITTLAETFKVSNTAAAIRFVTTGPFPCVLVCHDQSGRKWFRRHPDVPDNFFPNGQLDHESAAFEVVFGNKERTHRSIIGADAWFNLPYADYYDMYEETIRISNKQALTLLTWKDTKMLDRAAA